jgi:hypothetical protein
MVAVCCVRMAGHYFPTMLVLEGVAMPNTRGVQLNITTRCMVILTALYFRI